MKLSPPPFPPKTVVPAMRRWIKAMLALTLVAATQCVDGVTGPGKRSVAAFVPVWAPGASRDVAILDDGGLPLDRVRLILIRPVSDTVKDTTLTVHQGDAEFSLPLTVDVTAGSSLTAVLQFKSGETVLYEGKNTVQTVLPGQTSTPPAPLPMVYVGPGNTAVRVAVSPSSGSFQATAPITFTATVFDAQDQPIANAPLVWAASDSSLGTMTAPGVFTPTGKSGSVTITATTPTGVAGSATVTLTTVRVASALTLVSGNSQTDTTNAPLLQPLVVKVTDQLGQVMSGVSVSWTRVSGGGTLSTSATTTDANGLASAHYTLGPSVGTETVRASVVGISTPVDFTFQVTAGRLATTLTLISGDAQTDTVNASLSQPFVVKVVDQAGQPLSGVTVSWTRIAGAGALASATTVTDANGLSSVHYTLGASVGTETIRASVAGIATTLDFTGHVVAGRLATTLTIVSGNAQSDTVQKTLAQPLVVKVADQAGVAMAGVAVTWTRTSGNGALSASTSVTNASGLASVQYTFGSVAGVETVHGTTAGVAATADFTMTAVAGRPASIAIVSGNAQVDTILKTLANPFVVKVADAFGNVVNGATVTWTRIAGFGSTATPTSVTNSSGIASVGYRLGDTGGLDSVRASVSGVAATVTFAATVRDGLGQPIITGFAYLRVTPSPASGRVGDTLTFTADSISATGQATPVSVQWASDNPGRGAIDANGRLIVADTGVVIVTATRNALAGHARVSIAAAPVMSRFSFAPTTLNGVSNSPVTASFTFAGVDAGNGITSATLTLTSPTGSTATCTFGAPTTGTARNGVFDCALAFPQGSPAGTWHITSLAITGSITRVFNETALARFGSTTMTINP